MRANALAYFDRSNTNVPERMWMIPRDPDADMRLTAQCGAGEHGGRHGVLNEYALLTHLARLKYWMGQITGTNTNRGKLNGTHQG